MSERNTDLHLSRDYEANKVIQLKPFGDVIINTLIELIPDSWTNPKIQTAHGSDYARSASSARSARSAQACSARVIFSLVPNDFQKMIKYC
jgi:hypothetical protein